MTAVAAWLVVAGYHALAASDDVWSGIREAQLQMVGPALVLVVGAVFVAERLWPAVPRPALAPAHIVDAGYLLLFALIGPLITLLDVGFASELDRHAGFLELGRLPLVPQLVAVVITIIGIDAMNWAAHAANHRSAALWRFHALHHSQEDMSVFTTFRTHPLAHVSYLPALLPALVLGASGTVPVAALVAYGCFVTLPHANLSWTFGPLGRVLVSPAFHRLHHAREGRPVNLGFVLVCWDRLAGTAAWPDAGHPIETGIAGRPVVVEQDSDRRLTRVMATQLAQPFRVSEGMGATR